jgi:hypothetical protein
MTAEMILIQIAIGAVIYAALWLTWPEEDD